MINRLHDFLTATAAACPDDIALIDHADSVWSWVELVRSVEAAVDVLTSHGVGAGDRILLVFENCPSVAAFLYAASRLDVVAVVVNARITAIELDRIVPHCDPAALIFSTGASAAATEHASALGAATIDGAFGTVAVVRRAGSVA